MEKTITNLQDLILDTSKLDHSFFAYEDDRDAINALQHNDVINDWHIERIRRLNATANYLVLSLQKLQIFGDALSKFDNESCKDQHNYTLLGNHRAACREVCINIDTYVESIKSFCRYYFFMDAKETDNTLEWCKALRQYKEISGWIYIEKFLFACGTMFKNEDTKLLIRIRNEEVHNVSPFELINYKFEGKGLMPIPTEYVISNQDIHNKIVNVISLLASVVSSLQEILDNISPSAIYKYLSPQDGCLKNILKMKDRYKKEREYVRQFQ